LAAQSGHSAEGMGLESNLLHLLHTD
jgi:hypothetical protein